MSRVRLLALTHGVAALVTFALASFVGHDMEGNIQRSRDGAEVTPYITAANLAYQWGTVEHAKKLVGLSRVQLENMPQAPESTWIPAEIERSRRRLAALDGELSPPGQREERPLD